MKLLSKNNILRNVIVSPMIYGLAVMFNHGYGDAFMVTIFALFIMNLV